MDIPWEVGEVYEEQVNRANIPLKTRMENNAEITHYPIQNELVD